ncbi:hypothetical protein BGZ58_004983, partial [Dissophora ornata]
MMVSKYPECQAIRDTEEYLTKHMSECHLPGCSIKLAPGKIEFLERFESLFHYLYCERSYNAKSGIRKHLERAACRQEQADILQNPTTILDETPAALSSDTDALPADFPDEIPAVLSLPTADPLRATRSHYDAILYAYQQIHVSEADK